MTLPVALSAHLVVVAEPRVMHDPSPLQQWGALLRAAVGLRVFAFAAEALLLARFPLAAHLLLPPPPQPVLHRPVLRGGASWAAGPSALYKEQEPPVVPWCPLCSLDAGRLVAFVPLLVPVQS